MIQVKGIRAQCNFSRILSKQNQSANTPYSDFFLFSVGPAKKTLHPHSDFFSFSVGPVEKTLHPHPDFIFRGRSTKGSI